jgi:hypothetical protein
MNRGEFNIWQRRHQALFPNLNGWLEQQPEPRVILDAWAKALETCTAQHAAEATDRMLRGVAPLVEFNDWSSIPAVILQHCRLLGSGKVERSGDGNYVSGSTLKAMRKSFREAAPSDDSATFRDFDALIEVMDPADFVDTKCRILDSLDDGKLGMLSAFRLLVRAMQRRDGVCGGNVGELVAGGLV